MTIPPAPRVLVVDDDPLVGAMLREVLTGEGYRVTVVPHGLDGFAHAHRERPDLILLDIDLPGLSGTEICRRLKDDPATQLIPIVMITGGPFGGKVDAWQLGADEFLTKPFHLVEITARCRSLLRIKRLVGERDSAESVVFALARAVEAKSPYTHGHSERVTRYCLALAGAIGLTRPERETLRKGGLLHDVGKISIPDAILNKPGRLTAEEFDAIRAHPATGAHIVEPLSSVREITPLIRWHHERLDGTGYPDGIAGDDIPLLVRMLSVCDVYDSLHSDRPYRPSIPHAGCLEILREEAARGGLDADLVEDFCRLLGDAGEEDELADLFRQRDALDLLPHDGA